MIRDTGIPDRSKVDGVEAAQLIEPIFRHHPPSLQIGLTTPVKMLPSKSCTMAASGDFQNAETFGHDLMSDSVAFNNRDLVATHWSSLPGRFGHVPPGVDTIDRVPLLGF
jgi:hypothetical protein